MTAPNHIQVQQYHLKSPEDRERLALRAHGRPEGETEQRYAGLAQEEKILDWLHDCYFSTVSGDAPAFEAWYVPLQSVLRHRLTGLPGPHMSDIIFTNIS